MADIELNEDVPKAGKETSVVADEENGNTQKTPSDGVQVSWFELFRYATGSEKLLIFIAVIASIGNGVTLPLSTLIFGDLIAAFAIYEFNRTAPGAQEAFDEEITRYVVYFCLLAAGTFALSYVMMAAWMSNGEIQSKRIREAYFKSILSQNIAWFDSQKAGDLASRLAADTQIIQDGISEKVGLSIQFLATFFTGFIIAFVKGWKLALVLSAILPVTGLIVGLFFKIVSKYTLQGSDAYADSGALAEEVLSSIRTVISLHGSKREVKKYAECVEKGYEKSIKKTIVTGAGLGLVMFIMFSAYGLGFFYGSVLVENEELNVGEVLNVLFAFIIGVFSVGNIAPNVPAISASTGAGTKVFQVIDRSPPISSAQDSGSKPENIKGQIEFQNVKFHYETRPDVPVLQDISLVIQPGQTVAFVGESGSGKSTSVSLLERFYDVVEGQIKLDGVDIRDLNLKWLRDQIGLVAQEPILFNTTIAKNVALGKENATQEEIENACRAANAHDFIMSLPEKYDTDVGEKGGMLSGGQKQRVAIARALIKDPKIMLLDEATSALDTESERLVQAALDNASKGRTTLVIAHRLSTIKDADVIFVMERGQIIERGSHEALISKGGKYLELVQAQALNKTEPAENDVAHESDDNEDELENSIDQDKSKEGKTVTTVKKSDDSVAQKKDNVDNVRHSLKESTVPRVVNSNELDGTPVETSPIRRLFALNASEWPFIVLGALCASLNGAIMPLFALVFSEVLAVLGPGNENLRSEANFWSLMFLVLALVAGGVLLGQTSAFGVSGDKLSNRLRIQTFTALMTQEVAWYDRKENSAGALTTKLSTEAEDVKGITGALVGTVLQAIVSMVVGLSIAFANNVKLTLVILASFPAVALAGALQMRVLVGFGDEAKKAYEEAGHIATEAINHIRTVSSMNRERTFQGQYNDRIRTPFKLGIRRAVSSAVGFGISQAIMFLAYALAFYYGSRLVIDEGLRFDELLRVLFSVIFTAMGLGQLTTFLPSYTKGRLASIGMFYIIDRKPMMDPSSDEGESLEKVEGTVALENVKFRYPTRPQAQVLKQLSIQCTAGKTIALVGSSGCGKSTVMQLIERFYDPIAGAVTIDGKSVSALSPKYLHGIVGLVSQEPVLFNRTIRENIAYGRPDATLADVTAAAQQANLHAFIAALPSGYGTLCGERGAQLSGGQKQRLALARTLLLAPRLLLLDEATSALDTASERCVQAALEAARRGRTTLLIAHRLATVQNADWIYVLQGPGGRVVEQGVHQTLMQRQGVYYALCRKQDVQ